MTRSALLELLDQRRATRSIDPTPLSRETIDALVEAARLTPSCFNNQPWRFLLLSGEQGLEKGRKALTGGNRAWAITAPLLVVAYANPADDCQSEGGRRQYWSFDTGMAVMNLMLEATAQGLVARPMGGWDSEVLRDEFEVDDNDEFIVMVAIGNPQADESHLPEKLQGKGDLPRTRKDADEIVRRF